MYNRYIPQPDGTYRRNRMQESHNQEDTAPPQSPMPACPPPMPEPEPPTCRNCSRNSPPRRQPHRNVSPSTEYGSIGSFLRQLLPRDFDIEDLMIVLLLLLMAGDCQEDQNSALLTLVIYLFL